MAEGVCEIAKDKENQRPIIIIIRVLFTPIYYLRTSSFAGLACFLAPSADRLHSGLFGWKPPCLWPLPIVLRPPGMTDEIV